MEKLTTKPVRNRTFLFLSFPLAVLMIITSSTGLLTPDFYAVETPNWQAQSIWQDIVDLFLVVPGLIVTGVLAYRGSRSATMVWAGVMLYIAYTFTLYSFDIHFNKLFLLYCLCLGLSFYSFLYFLFTSAPSAPKAYMVRKSLRNITGAYLILVSLIFYGIWLADIIPSVMENTTPQSLIEVGLFTNGVHVIDLSVFLPGVFLTGLFLLKNRTLGYTLTPVMLTFFVLMDITIGLSVVFMRMRGFDIALMLTAVMSVFTLTSFALLIWLLKSCSENKVVNQAPNNR